ncbi:MAG: diguanylate cyclase, partial [Candidatus Eremiobacteraeota bacterium]|nr:diguanylate cyclase [Candidatus Eremiobacteraeota bacterium]
SGRNLGTELTGPARAAFDRGQGFAGKSAVAGRNFINRYDALRDARGDVVGVMYTGVPLTTMDAAAREIMRVVVAGTTIALFPSLFALYLITRPVGRTFLRAVAVAQGLARGNVDQLTRDSSDRAFMNDEFGDVNKAFNEMIAYQQRMTVIADAIAGGDLSNDVAPASSLDRLGIAFARMTENLRTLVLQLETTALTDNLTQLGNRRAFDHHMIAEISRVARHGGVLSLAMIDIDQFKAVNDRQGHQGGDAVLAKLGELLKTVRLEDAAYRIGGDEFALIMPDTSSAEAQIIAERIRSAAQTQLSGATISVGIASSADGLLDAQTLQRRADSALYAGKLHGRNVVVLYDAVAAATAAGAVVAG